MPRALALAALILGSSACSEQRSNTIAIEIVGPQALDPIGDDPGGDLDIVVEQQDQDPIVRRSDNIGSLAELQALEIVSHGLPTRILVKYVPDEGPTQIGATPFFVPGVAGVARVPIGPVRGCQIIDATRLRSPRLEPAVWRLYGTRWIVFGGATERGGHSDIASFSPVWLTIDRDDANVAEGSDATGVSSFDEPLAETQIVELFPRRALILAAGASGGALFVVAPDPDPLVPEIVRSRVEGTSGHFGLGAGSTLVDLENAGAAVVGGGDALSASDSITWLREDGSISRQTRLAHPRFRPSVVRIGTSLLVAGGQAEGSEQIEIVAEGADGIAVASPRTARVRPALVAPPPSLDAARGAALVIGGADSGNVPIASVLRIGGCPGECIVTEDPTLVWEAPRLLPTVVRTSSATLLLGGEDAAGGASDRIDRITFVTATDVSFEQGGRLDQARTRGVAVEVEQDIVLFFGGQSGPFDPLDSFEMCWPAALPDLD